LAAVLLVVLSPVLLACCIAIRLNSPGNAIFSQRRTGAGGKTFTMYKLRSMYKDAEKKSGPQWSQPGDSRVTVVGRFLRFAHLDEIPQLFNVVRGEMALVGPRPERPSIVKELIPLVDGYEKRHAIKPGITGLAQIYLPPDEDIKSVRAKVGYDLIYLRYACVQMDFRIAVCTVLRMVGVRQGQGPRWTGLTREVDAIRLLNKQRSGARREEPAKSHGLAAIGENRMQRLHEVEYGFATKDSGITTIIGNSVVPDYATPKRRQGDKLGKVSSTAKRS
jgi:lipopolysaccharide/colanic/teichoic acid biosynthesis glycosyltransferase